MCFQVRKEIILNTGTAHLPREKWDAWDPILIAEGLFATANIFRRSIYNMILEAIPTREAPYIHYLRKQSSCKCGVTTLTASPGFNNDTKKT
ncbi:hypothetical protein AVEN_126277-1 [Araneus ventricosus]|uniref:Uncharacterized protein n=1 Tax=Araneus ventricosus TaxID=182803 RepID=A0A4Y2TU66_ARAVE|nr:hypothetical protein AVEN_126277-1 [Araneus ventricosus]